MVSTLNYLINNVVPQLPKSHPFLWDRTRSIRQDFTYQNYSGPEAIECNELIARIHLLCLHVMSTSDQDYSKQQELEQLNKTLQTLSELYDSNRKHNPHFRSPREAEFRSYILLSHIKDPDIDRQTQLLPFDIFNSPEIQTAILLRGLMQQAHGVASKDVKENCVNLFAALFQLINTKNVSFLSACLLESHFQDIRFGALASMARAYHTKGKPYTLSRLTKLFGFNNDDDTASFCTSYGMTVAQDDQQMAVNVAPTSLNQQTSFKPFFARYIDSKVGNKAWAACIIENPFSASFTSTSVGFQTKAMASNLKPFQTVLSSTQSQVQSLAPSNNNVVLKKPEQSITAQSLISPEFHSPSNVPKSFINESVSILNNTSSNGLRGASLSALPAFSFSSGGTGKPGAPGFNFGVQSHIHSSVIKPTVSESGVSPQPLLSSFNNVSKSDLQTIKPADLVLPPNSIVPAPAPVLKVVEKYVYSDSDLKTEVNNLFHDFVFQALKCDVLPKAWDTTQQARAKIKEDQLNAAVAEEFDGLISGLLVEIAKSVQADKMNQRRLKRLAMKLVGRAAFIARTHIEEKKQRELEYKLISSQLGKPRVVVFPPTAATVSARNRCANFQLIGDLTPEERYNRKMKTIKKQREKEAEFWKPFNVQTMIADKLENNLRKNSSYGLVELRFSVFCRDWDTVVGKWVQTKLNLGHVVKSSSNGTTVYLEQLQQEISTYQDMTQLVLMVGLDCAGQPDSSLEYDREACAAILEMIKDQSRYKLDILVLYWGGGSKSETLLRKALGFDESGLEFGTINFSAIENSIDGADPSFQLERAVLSLVDKFDGQLSNKGVRERRDYQHEQAEIRVREEHQAYQEQLRAQLEEFERRQLRIKSMKGLHMFEDKCFLGGLAATSTDCDQTLPAQKRQKTTGLVSVENKCLEKDMVDENLSLVPKGVQELRNLVAAVKRSRSSTTNSI